MSRPLLWALLPLVLLVAIGAAFLAADPLRRLLRWMELGRWS